MYIPIFSDIRRLDAAPRRFIQFSAVNVFSWQCVVGPVMVLLARKIDMPPSWVGVLIAAMPLTAALAIFTGSWVARLGPRRLLMSAWTGRNLAACSVFLLPWAMSLDDPRAGWAVLMCACLSFCIVRSFGVGGWYPWLHEILPASQRGGFFSGEIAAVHFTNAFVILGQALWLAHEPALSHYLAVYAAGIVTGILSMGLMIRIPGGEKHAAETAPRADYSVALGDRPFRELTLIVNLGNCATAWFSTAILLYMRDAMGLSPRPILVVTALGSAGAFLMVHFWGRYAEHSGSGRAMYKTLIAHTAAPLGCLALAPGNSFAFWLVAPAAIAAVTYFLCFSMAANRAMLHAVAREGRVGYTNIWIVANALSLGVTPILAGLVIERFGLTGYRVCFVLSAVLGLAAAILCALRLRDGESAERQVRLRTGDGVAIMGRIVRISLGLHSSNR